MYNGIRTPDHTSSVVSTVVNGQYSCMAKFQAYPTRRKIRGSLIDRGANGGILGLDAQVLRNCYRTIDVTGIDNHELNALPLVDAYSKVMSSTGPIILILREYANHGVGRTIHSAVQIEAQGHTVDDRSMKANGKQHILTTCGRIIPLDILNGLPILPMTIPTKDEFQSLPHVIFTTQGPWDPNILDNRITNTSNWFPVIQGLNNKSLSSPFDEFGDLINRVPDTATEDIPQILDSSGAHSVHDITTDLHKWHAFAASTDYSMVHDRFSTESLWMLEAHARQPSISVSVIEQDKSGPAKDAEDLHLVIDDQPFSEKPTGHIVTSPSVSPTPIDYKSYIPYFLFVPEEKIRRTFQNSTQYATNVPVRRIIGKTYQSPYPFLNVRRRNEPVATDTVYAATPAINGGYKMAQIFVGRKSLVIHVYGMKTKSQFINALEDEIRNHGAMDTLISDGAAEELSDLAKALLRSLLTRHWKSERAFQHQNPAEHRWRFLKQNVNWWMNWRKIPANIWLLCMEWVADVMNMTAERSLGHRIPLEVLLGHTIDISILLCFLFWDIVMVTRYEDKSFNGQVGHPLTNEIKCRFVGFAWDTGHALTFKLLTIDTQKVIHRSQVRLADDPENNIRNLSPKVFLPTKIYARSINDDKANDDDFVLPTVDVTTDPITLALDKSLRTPSNAPEPTPTPDGETPDDTHLPIIPPDRGEQPSSRARALSRIQPLSRKKKIIVGPNGSILTTKPKHSTSTKDSNQIGTKPDPKKLYEVEDIIAARKRNGNWEYKVRWKGYQEKDDTWEPMAHLTGELRAKAEEIRKSKRKVRFRNTPEKGEKPTKSQVPRTVKELTNVDDSDDEEPPELVPRRRSKRLKGNASTTTWKRVRSSVANKWNRLKGSINRAARHNRAPFVETVTDEDELDKPTSMDNTPLKDMPVVEMFEVKESEDYPEFMRETREPGGPNPKNTPFKFEPGSLKTDAQVETKRLPPEELVGRTFLMPPLENGERHRAKLLEILHDHKEATREHVEKDPDYINFKVRIGTDIEEIVAYNDVVDYIEKDEYFDSDTVWRFREILDWKRVTPEHPEFKGSRINLLVRWENGETTWEPYWHRDKTGLSQQCPVDVALFLLRKGLIGQPGFEAKWIRDTVKNVKKLRRRVNQAKLHSYRTRTKWKYGFEVPRNHDHAMELDAKNGNTRWRDAEIVELTLLGEYSAFKDIGKGGIPGPGYKKIRVHMVYDVKNDGRHRARLVAGGHLTDTPIESVYSSVVSLRGARILMYLAEHLGLETWQTDISSAYLESFTKEKVWIVAGPEFGDLEGHALIIVKALYGLKSSGLRWHERFADVLRDLGFFPSKAEPDIWLRDKGDHYEYIAVYVDDLLILSKDPKAIVAELTDPKKGGFKVKGTGEISFYLGCDFFRDAHKVLCYSPRKYTRRLLDAYEQMFGTKPKLAASPLVKGDHPELDTTALCNEEDSARYLSLIGALQWVIQIGRFDITTPVMTLSRFRCAPRVGHLDRVKRIFGYIAKFPNATIRIRTSPPDYSDLPYKDHDWSYTCYAGAKECVPHDAPKPYGEPVQITSWFDANLYHDYISGRSVTGIIHMFNKTPIDWYSKLQSTVETATFGSEYIAARTCVEQIIDLRNTLRYLGVKIQGASIMFGDNESVINTASVPYSKLAKRHNALAYHRTREAVAADIVRIYHIPGSNNIADIVSKHWDHPSIWPTLKPILFWEGDTADCKQLEIAMTIRRAHRGE